jgi:Transglycosylase SLT domain/Peptidase family M23
VLRSRKLRVAIAAAISALTLFGLAGLPAASADTCVVTVTLVGGQKVNFTVDVPPNTPLSSIKLPVSGPVAGVTESCTSTPTTSSTTTPSTTSTTPSSTTTKSGSTTTTSPSRSPSHPPHTRAPAKVQKPSQHQSSSKQPSKKQQPSSSNPGSSKSKSSTKKPSKPKPSGQGGVPTAANPTFSFALPGPAPMGVPNFFIDSFRIPPFLLPIYQAAGIQYDVPWQVLAGINEIETDYGRNLSVSSAGAIGWMQFMPATWKTWGVDGNGDGVADPYNPVDAIFSAARYLHAAGASKNLNQAIFAYNHASWYVQSVLLRAKLIGGMPQQLIGALTGLVSGHFPVAAPSKYADSNVAKLAKKRVHSGNAAVPIDSNPNDTGVSIFAKKNSPAIAVNDGKIVKVGSSDQLGRYIKLQDSTGNVYTYAHLGSIPKQYPVPKPVKLTAADLAKELAATKQQTTPAKPLTAASAGTQNARPTPSTATATKEAKSGPPTLPVTPAPASKPQTQPEQTLVKERLFAYPTRPASYAAGGAQQIKNTANQISSFRNYFSDVLHLGRNQYTLKPLKAGSIVVAGTILGRVAAGNAKTASHMVFMIQPAGKNAPQIDPKPILDGWKLLEATAVYRAAGVDPFFGPGAKNPTVGQVLLMSKEQLQNRVLEDPHVSIYACGRRDVQSGLIDRRVLATIEFLSASGLYPTVSGLDCGHSLKGQSGTAGADGTSVELSKINNIPIRGHQGPGSITDITIRRLLTLQGAMAPDQIISDMSYKGQNETLALPDHADQIQVTFTPLFGNNKKLSNEIKTILKPNQWIQLINRISQIPEPVVPIAPSKYAIKTHGAS